MYTANFVHENKSHSVRRVRYTDGTLRALATFQKCISVCIKISLQQTKKSLIQMFMKREQ